MQTSNMVSGPTRTSAAFRIMQAQIINLAIEGKELAEKNKDKTLKCLSNSMLWATDGVIRRHFSFDLDPAKAFAASLKPSKDSESRRAWLKKFDHIIAKAKVDLSETEELEIICLNLLEQAKASFEEGAYSRQISLLFLTAQYQLCNPVKEGVADVAAVSN